MIVQVMAIKRQPEVARLEQIANDNPLLINAFVAYFVLEWQSVASDKRGLHGKDQVGYVCFIPNYVKMWGMDECLERLHNSPSGRGPDDPGGLSLFFHAVVYGNQT